MQTENASAGEHFVFYVPFFRRFPVVLIVGNALFQEADFASSLLIFFEVLNILGIDTVEAVTQCFQFVFIVAVSRDGKESKTDDAQEQGIDALVGPLLQRSMLVVGLQLGNLIGVDMRCFLCGSAIFLQKESVVGLEFQERVEGSHARFVVAGVGSLIPVVFCHGCFSLSLPQISYGHCSVVRVVKRVGLGEICTCMRIILMVEIPFPDACHRFCIGVMVGFVDEG